jgi:hypothetical protein
MTSTKSKVRPASPISESWRSKNRGAQTSCAAGRSPPFGPLSRRCDYVKSCINCWTASDGSL